jgi:hypothetical protein
MDSLHEGPSTCWKPLPVSYRRPSTSLPEVSNFLHPILTRYSLQISRKTGTLQISKTPAATTRVIHKEGVSLP